MPKDKLIVCTFCHKSKDVVEVIISTPVGFKPKAYICDECVASCSAIVEEKRKELEIPPTKRPRKKRSA
jgi:ATP-dependent protease Clp ATPase subunit